MSTEQRYVPATGRLPFLRAYDSAIALTMRESAWRSQLVTWVLADVAEGPVVDVGAGTGTLAISLAGPRVASVIGVDGDERVLDLARLKPDADLVDWRVGLATDLPVDAATADVVVMSLLLHHLHPEDKLAALREAARVLRPGGALYVADWGPAHDALMRFAFAGLQLLDGRATTRDHVAGLVPGLIETAGFQTPQRSLRLRTVWGSFEVLRSVRS
ncbi:methyltransferase domain-containing protein [Conexibacter sp. W3-3-2]|uniref:class I SAM-dependent methyltransferase n=1 Tax=Conexibacter sp. W3-3-2 TaxID=2675227 RepID=UPI0012B87D4C|nr:class I SAM-dependent methyltransferase [Conexibacter sp. W3-3-2]MTD47527.1 methyltransferase domain-containing protein [Conexibacter sp. W3-3-2]